MLRALESCVDIWYIAQVDQARSMAADKVAQTMKSVRISGEMPHYRLFDSVELAYSAACEQLEQEDIVLVTGSFFTVAAVYSLSEQV
jgi:dihydrofolate synthase/folylpolyglutamate synthase